METSQTAGAPEYETVTPSRLKTGSRCSSGTGVCRAASSPSLAWDWLATAFGGVLLLGGVRPFDAIGFAHGRHIR